MDSRGRRYPGLLARFIIFRDQICRTRCDAPIHRTDHIRRHTEGGETSERNGQGTCEGCNTGNDNHDEPVAPTPQQAETTSYPPAEIHRTGSSSNSVKPASLSAPATRMRRWAA